jgi:hypothetical protein
MASLLLIVSHFNLSIKVGCMKLAETSGRWNLSKKAFFISLVGQLWCLIPCFILGIRNLSAVASIEEQTAALLQQNK